MKNFFIRFWPVFFICSLWFIFGSPYFLKGRVPYPSDYQVNNFNPWSQYKNFWGPIKNGAMSDVVDEIYPWKHFTINSWKNRYVPLWNPYSFSGNPHLGNYQSSVFTPFNLLFFVLPFVDAWSIVVLLQPLIAGLGMYFFSRSLRMSKFASVLSSTTFMFCGFIVVWMEYGTLAMAIAWLPVALYAIENFYRKENIFSLIVLFITLLLSFFSGHFQTSIYFASFVCIFLVFKAISEKQYRKTFLAVYVFMLGISASFIQIIPSIELYTLSVRSSIIEKSRGIPFYYLVNLFAPDYFGNPVTRNDWFGFYAEWASFVGIIPLTLAALSLLRKNKYTLFFIISFLFSLILAISSPVDIFLQTLKIPVLSTSGPSRIIVLSSFSIAILAGFGLDMLADLLKKRSYKKTIPVFLPILCVLALSVLVPYLIHMPHDKRIISQHNLLIPVLLFVLFFGIFILNTFVRAKKMIVISLLAIPLLASYDSFRFAQKWMPFEKKSEVSPKLPVITSMKNAVGSGRAFGNFGAYLDTYFEIPSVEGYDPLYSQRYGEFMYSSQTGEFQDAGRSVVKLDRKGKYIDRVLDLLAVNVIYHPTLDTKQAWAYPVWKDTNRFKKFFDDGHFQLYKNATALPRLKLFYNYETESDDKKLLRRFYADFFDFRNTLILEYPVGDLSKNAQGSVRIMKNLPNQITANVSTNGTALLFLSDTYYPGWKAIDNGRQVPIERADYAFRAIKIGKGEHLIKFEYDPQIFAYGEYISAVSIAGFILVLLFLQKKKVELF